MEYSKVEITPEKDSYGKVVSLKINRTIMLDYVANGIRKKGWELKGMAHKKKR